MNLHVRLTYSLAVFSAFLFSCASEHESLKDSSWNSRFIHFKPSISTVKGDTFESSLHYHSAYHTENPYYDGLNYILDGRISDAEKVLIDSIDVSEDPWRTCLWIYICKCIEGNLNEADEFLKKYVEDHKLDPEDDGPISAAIRYYYGSISEKDYMFLFNKWDDNQSCIGYCYYGLYKKYHDEDITNGNLYLSKAHSFDKYMIPEYRISEKEVKGYTPRFTGRYKDFPLVESPHAEPGFLTPLDANGLPSVDEIKSYLPSYMQPNLNEIPPEERLPIVFPGMIGGTTLEMFNYLQKGGVGIQYPSQGNIYGNKMIEREISDVQEQPFVESTIIPDRKSLLPPVPNDIDNEHFIVPKAEGEGWDVLDKEGLMSTLKEEAALTVQDLLNQSGCLYVAGIDGYRFYPIGKKFRSYCLTYVDFISLSKELKKDYGIEQTDITPYLSKGDYVSGIAMPCRVFNETTNAYEDEVYVSISLLFSVNEDRTVDLIHTVQKVFKK